MIRSGAWRPWLALAVAGLLAACSSTPGVRVSQAAAPPLGTLPPVQLIAQHEDDRWASSHALRAVGLREASDSGGSWTLRAYSSHTTETRPAQDPFCSSWSLRRYWGYGGWYDPWYGPFGPSHCRFPPTRRTYEVRTLTWALEDAQGTLRWYASARQRSPQGPPMEEANRLAQALRQWIGGK